MRALFLLFLTASLAGCAMGPWRNDILDNGNQCPKGRYLQLRPAFINETLWAASRAGKVKAYHGPALEHVASLHEVLVAGPTVCGNKVLVASETGEVIALDTEANELWRHNFGSPVYTKVACGPQQIYIRTLDGSLIGVNGENGATLWRTTLEQPALMHSEASNPVATAAGVVVASADGRVFHFSKQGYKLWEATVALPKGRTEVERMVDSIADPVIEGNVAWIATLNGSLASIDLSTGNILNRAEASTMANILVMPSMVVLVTPQNTVKAFSKPGLKVLWEKGDLEHKGGLTNPIAWDGAICIADNNGALFSLDPKTGEVIARATIRKDMWQLFATPHHVYGFTKGRLLSILRSS